MAVRPDAPVDAETYELNRVPRATAPAELAAGPLPATPRAPWSPTVAGHGVRRCLCAAQNRGFYSAVPGGARREGSTRADLTVVGDGFVRSSAPTWSRQNPRVSLCLTIPQEHSQIRCTTIGGSNAYGRRIARRDVAGQLLAEPPSRVSAAGAALAANLGTCGRAGCERGRHRQEGVCLITRFRQHRPGHARLARAVRARLVLVGRSMPPPQETWQA